MNYTREAALKKLLEGYKAFYNIIPAEEAQEPLVAVCEYYEHNEQFMISRKVNLWSSESEEFIYLYDVPVLTMEVFEKCRDFAREDGLKRAHIQAGHMYTYITPIIICDSYEPDALKALKKCSIHKSFRFSLHGWMDVHFGVYVADEQEFYTNSSGKCMVKTVKKILS